MDCTFCGICPVRTFVDRKTTRFLVKTNDSVQGNFRWVRKVAIFDEAHDLFGCLPVVGIKKWGLGAGILERPVCQEDFADICVKNFWRWYNVLASFANPLW